MKPRWLPGLLVVPVLLLAGSPEIAGGQTKKYPVPVLEVLVTFRDLATGAIESAGITAQLPPAPGEQPRAITSGQAVPPPPSRNRPAELLASINSSMLWRRAVSAPQAWAR